MSSRRPQIAPSILSADFGYLMDNIREVEDKCRFLHIDVMDGHFAQNFSIGIPVIKTIRKYTDMVFDTHLMIENPDRYVKEFADAGSDYITFHIECVESDVAAFALIYKIRSFGKKAGVAIHPHTPIERIYPFLEKDAADLILVMSVIPGFGGQSYMEGSNERLSEIRERLDKHGSEAYLSIDGGINSKTIVEAVDSGADLLVSGSSVFGKEDIKGALEGLMELI